MSESIDGYKTIEKQSESEHKAKGSKFLGYLLPMKQESELADILKNIKSMHPKAGHHCYAYRLKDTNAFRYNDDGEPSGTAGKPIYNQILSSELVDACCVVVRYWGGTKLGTSGLISAYKEGARLAIDDAIILQKYEQAQLDIHFDYAIMGQLMESIKKLNIEIVDKSFDSDPKLTISTRASELTTAIIKIKADLLNRPTEDVSDDDTIDGIRFGDNKDD
jgi:uncharacterized YigZ family protein